MAAKAFETFVRPTREYIGGVLAGVGIGLVTATALRFTWSAPVIIPAFVFIAIGGFLAWSGQKRLRARSGISV